MKLKFYLRICAMVRGTCDVVRGACLTGFAALGMVILAGGALARVAGIVLYVACLMSLMRPDRLLMAGMDITYRS